jgi:putative holliday junction resolvase
MGKAMAFDWGLKRIGISVTDELRIIASGLTTVENKNIFPFISDYILQNKVDDFVVGMPKRLNNTDTHSTEDVRKFIKELETKYPSVKITEIDERFTSKMASAVISQSNKSKKKKQNKSLIDEISATIILQSYLDTL